MIIISWNVRGLNNDPRIKVVWELVRSHSLDVIFLQENKVSVECMMGLAPKLWKNGQCQCIGAQGSSGGVTCLWIVRFNLHGGYPLSPPYPWFLCVLSRESLFFSPMSMLLLSSKVNFLYGLISILFAAYFLIFHGSLLVTLMLLLIYRKKWGGNARLEPTSLFLQDNISTLNLVDIKPSNGQFTWNNRSMGDSCIAEWLDHFMVSYFLVGGL